MQVPLFERGYEKDPAGVALEAQRQAKKDGIAVVLVDTAGRMQASQQTQRMHPRSLPAKFLYLPIPCRFQVLFRAVPLALMPP